MDFHFPWKAEDDTVLEWRHTGSCPFGAEFEYFPRINEEPRCSQEPEAGVSTRCERIESEKKANQEQEGVSKRCASQEHETGVLR